MYFIFSLNYTSCSQCFYYSKCCVHRRTQAYIHSSQENVTEQKHLYTRCKCTNIALSVYGRIRPHLHCHERQQQGRI